MLRQSSASSPPERTSSPYFSSIWRSQAKPPSSTTIARGSRLLRAAIGPSHSRAPSSLSPRPVQSLRPPRLDRSARRGSLVQCGPLPPWYTAASAWHDDAAVSQSVAEELTRIFGRPSSVVESAPYRELVPLARRGSARVPRSRAGRRRNASIASTVGTRHRHPVACEPPAPAV